MPLQTYQRHAGAVALVTAAVLAVAVPASAADPEVVFTGETSQTLEYGQYWIFAARFPSGVTSEYSVVSTGTPSGYTPQVYAGQDPSDPAYSTASVAAPYDVAPLKVGSYTFTLHVKQSYGGTTTFEGETATPAQLTVAPAKLGVTVRAVPDPSNSDSAIVTATFSGRFVDEYSSSFFPSSAISPEGTWHIAFTDSAGELAIERSIERAAGDDVLATSFAWDDAEPGETYAVSAEFVPSGASASNFSVTNATDFSYTAPDSARPVPTSTATEKPDASLPEATGFGLPLWLLITVGVLILALAALVTVLSVRLSRRPTSSTGEVAA